MAALVQFDVSIQYKLCEALQRILKSRQSAMKVMNKHSVLSVVGFGKRLVA